VCIYHKIVNSLIYSPKSLHDFFNLVHSDKYRSLDEYLIPKAEWDAHRAEYLQRAQWPGRHTE
jgi:hypothetical protein